MTNKQKLAQFHLNQIDNAIERIIIAFESGYDNSMTRKRYQTQAKEIYRTIFNDAKLALLGRIVARSGKIK